MKPSDRSRALNKAMSDGAPRFLHLITHSAKDIALFQARPEHSGLFDTAEAQCNVVALHSFDGDSLPHAAEEDHDARRPCQD